MAAKEEVGVYLKRETGQTGPSEFGGLRIWSYTPSWWSEFLASLELEWNSCCGGSEVQPNGAAVSTATGRAPSSERSAGAEAREMLRAVASEET